MDRSKDRVIRRSRRRMGLRKRIRGTPGRPRLAVYKSLKHMYAQIIDDLAGKTLCAASTAEVDAGPTGNKTAAAAVGKMLAERAKAAGVSDVAFDRAGFKYHGRLKALADAAREHGLKF